MRAVVEDARADVAALAGCDPTSVIFTSGATEANAMAMKRSHGPVAAARIEHPSILENINDIREIASLPDGSIDLQALQSLLEGPEAIATVAVMAANNETGVFQPVAEAGELCRAHGAHLHVDAVQHAGKAGLPEIWAHCDSMSVTAHKIGGPTGVGALIVRDPGDWPALIAGGGQEQRLRCGTENVPGIAGFGAAAKAAVQEADGWTEVRGRRDRLEAAMRDAVPEIRVIGGAARRLPNTSCTAVPGVPSALSDDAPSIWPESPFRRARPARRARWRRRRCSPRWGSRTGLPNRPSGSARGPIPTEEDIDRFLSAWRETVAAKAAQ